MSDFRIVAERNDLAAFRDSLVDRGCGGYVQFEGWVRDQNDSREVLRLEYEVYEPMAVKEGRRIIQEATERFGVQRVPAVHRSGLLELTDIAVVVGVASPHAVDIAANNRLRGSDAVYAAVALRFGTEMITLDREQLDRLPKLLPVRAP